MTPTLFTATIINKHYITASLITSFTAVEYLMLLTSTVHLIQQQAIVIWQKCIG